jgi:folate-binding Fe-S cluster repair protein YgfZ
MTATRLFDRAVLRLSPQEAGEDVAGFLQGLVTSDMKGPLPVWTGLLTAQGKALFDFIVWRDGDDLLVDCEAGAADALAAALALPPASQDRHCARRVARRPLESGRR